MSSPQPLIQLTEFPDFTRITPEQIEPAVDHWLAAARDQVEQVIQQAHPSWESAIQPLQESADQLSRAWSVVSHLNSVCNTPELRAAYQACLPKLSAYSTWFNQHPELYRLYQQVAQQADLHPDQQQALRLNLRDFQLSGIDLPPKQQTRFADIQQRLSELSNQFSNQVLDATQAWQKHITDETLLAGLPESARQSAAAAAQAKGLEGWLLTLDFPSFYPVMTYADHRPLREEVYTAYVTRASDQGPDAGRWDNAPLIEEILALRQEKAELLGFKNYADYSIARKMAPTSEAVIDFLQQLAQQARPQALQDMAELQAFAQQQGQDQLQAWDVGYFAEKLRQQRYALNQEELKPWFAAPQVVQGLLRISSRLFGITFSPATEMPVWHPDVQAFHIEREGERIASFYLDLYAREGKRGGAWMADLATRRERADGSVQKPIAFLTCNFTPPIGDQVSLLTHQEVTTLFHEFGHGLHHLLTQVTVPDVAGINGVAWDAVELPSQFMENFCWEREGLDEIAAHQETGAPLPQDLFDKLLAAKNFQSAMQMMRQLEFSLFDFRLHQQQPAPDRHQVQALLDQIRATVSVVPATPFNRFQNSFSHIFAGGYAAGYYSYKWAEVLSADAFSAFEEEGILNSATGQRFMESILERGGAEEAMTLFVRFRGREPQIEALLRHNGIQAATELSR
ncbi:M3 family metallopeptidase [Marinospirillum sp.]|uniref:M3 family metallopeptidase n=1 Tax=Marinospirillum sp. TaxID=2183934 RepID=UPI003A8C4CD4